MSRERVGNFVVGSRREGVIFLRLQGYLFGLSYKFTDDGWRGEVGKVCKQVQMVLIFIESNSLRLEVSFLEVCWFIGCIYRIGEGKLENVIFFQGLIFYQYEFFLSFSYFLFIRIIFFNRRYFLSYRQFLNKKGEGSLVVIFCYFNEIIKY